MDFLRKLFPLSFKHKETGKDLAVSIIVYAVMAIIATIILAIAGWVSGLLPGVLEVLTGIILGFIGTVVDVYATGGIVLSILVFTKVIKEQ